MTDEPKKKETEPVKFVRANQLSWPTEMRDDIADACQRQDWLEAAASVSASEGD